MAKVISIKQPWAYLVVIGAKKIETRPFYTHYRGELLIHCSAKIDFSALDLCQIDERFNRYIPDVRVLEQGKIIGKVNVVACVDTITMRTLPELTNEERAFGDYSDGRYAWLLSDPVKFDNPVPAQGRLGLWDFNLKR